MLAKFVWELVSSRSKSSSFISMMLSASFVHFWHEDETLGETEIDSGRQKASSDRPASACSIDGEISFFFPARQSSRVVLD